MSFKIIDDNLKREMLKCNEKFANGDLDGAYQNYLNLLIDNPGNPYLLHNAGVVCFNMKKYAIGAQHFIDAIDNNPDEFIGNWMGYYNAAHCCVCAGNMVKAKSYIEKSRSINSEDENTNKLYGKIMNCYISKID